MKICVIGLGYIGLPTSAMLAKAGHEVVGVDKKQEIVDALNEGRITIEEPGLAEFIRGLAGSGRLRAVTEPETADAFIIAVPTPITADKKADMRFVESATRSIVPVLKKGDLVILESTSPVGTVDRLMKPILDESGLEAGRDYSLGHSPERVIPGNILYELVHNHRIAGGFDEESAHRIAALYRTFVEGEIFETDSRTAEMAKLSENTFRDVNIAFANELAKICEREGINVWKLIELCNKHPRVNIHQPGPGVGGHCIAVDPWFIVEQEPEVARIIHLARQTNDSMPAYVLGRAVSMLAGIRDPKVCILGVTYKPDVDDMRESPILELIELLRERQIRVSCSDPFVGGRGEVLADPLEAAKDADLLILGVNHKQYLGLDFAAFAAVMRSRLLLDTRNVVDQDAARKAGFSCELLGR